MQWRGVAWRGVARVPILARERLDVVGGQQAVLAAALDGAVHPALRGRLAPQYHVALLHAHAAPAQRMQHMDAPHSHTQLLTSTRTQWPSLRAYIERDFVRVGRAVRVDGAEERLLR